MMDRNWLLPRLELIAIRHYSSLDISLGTMYESKCINPCLCEQNRLKKDKDKLKFMAVDWLKSHPQPTCFHVFLYDCDDVPTHCHFAVISNDRGPLSFLHHRLSRNRYRVAG